MRSRIFLLLSALALAGLTSCAGPKLGDQEAPSDQHAVAHVEPMVLDLSSYYIDRFPPPKPTHGKSRGINGQQTFDGLPFLVRGRAFLYGRYDSRAREQRPDLLGIKVGRCFDELHLLHTTRWPDLEGTAIARVHFHYSDGASSSLPIRYGVHVRDWQRLQSEVQEALNDDQSKVVWRGPGKESFKSSERMFKSMLKNPLPQKLVDRIDIVSTGQLASYSLSAATVTNSDSSRPVTTPVPLDWPEHDFDGRFNIQVSDQNNRPLAGVWITVSLMSDGMKAATVSMPMYSDANGEGIGLFPTKGTNLIYISVRKDGWAAKSRWLKLSGPDAFKSGDKVTFQLKRNLEDENLTTMVR